MPGDARNRFEQDVFAHKVTKDGKVLIWAGGRLITTVAGNNATNLIARLGRADRREVQHLLARATGHYKHGNER